MHGPHTPLQTYNGGNFAGNAIWKILDHEEAVITNPKKFLYAASLVPTSMAWAQTAEVIFRKHQVPRNIYIAVQHFSSERVIELLKPISRARDYIEDSPAIGMSFMDHTGWNAPRLEHDAKQVNLAALCSGQFRYPYDEPSTKEASETVAAVDTATKDPLPPMASEVSSEPTAPKAGDAMPTTTAMIRKAFQEVKVKGHNATKQDESNNTEECQNAK